MTDLYMFLRRLFTLMSTHKVEFAKVACYLVADYVGELQKVTLLPATKVLLQDSVIRRINSIFV